TEVSSSPRVIVREPTVAIVSVGAPLAPAGPAAWAAVTKMSPAPSEAINETIRMAILLFAEKRGGYGGGRIGSSGAGHARVTAQGLLAERQAHTARSPPCLVRPESSPSGSSTTARRSFALPSWPKT